MTPSSPSLGARHPYLTAVAAGGSVWPAAVVHGVANAVVHTNRIGVDLEMTVGAAALLAAAPIPMVVYAIFMLRSRGSRLPAAR